MSEMIERVAGAIMRANFSRPVELQGINVSVPDNLDLARAAIEAMRDPTEVMCEAGAKFYHDNYRQGHAKEDTSMALIWGGMIDAALADEQAEEKK